MVKRTPAELATQNDNLFADNNTQDITPQRLRSHFADINDSQSNIGNLTSGRVPYLSNDGVSFEDTSISETDSEVIINKNTRVIGDLTSNSGTLRPGQSLGISDGADSISISSRVTGLTGFPLVLNYNRAGGSVALAIVPNVSPAEAGIFQPDDSVETTITESTPFVATFTQLQDAIGWAQKFRGTSGKMRFHIDVPGAGGGTVRIHDGDTNLNKDADFDNPDDPVTGEVEVEFITPVDLRLNQVLTLTFYSADGNDVVVRGSATSPYFQSTFSDRSSDVFAPLDDTATDANHTLSAQMILSMMDNSLSSGYAFLNADRESIGFNWEVIGFGSIDPSEQEITGTPYFKYIQNSGASTEVQCRIVYAGSTAAHLSDVYYEGSNTETTFGEYIFNLTRTATVLPTENPFHFEVQVRRVSGASCNAYGTSISYTENV